MKPYMFTNPFDRRKSGGQWPKIFSGRPNKSRDSVEKSMRRWFKRIARRFSKQQINEQLDMAAD